MTENGVTPINERAALFASILVCQIHDGPDSTDLDLMGHDFDAWLADIRAAAWEEGRTAGRSDTHDHPAPNPFLRAEEMTRDE